jgi:hypothetical protein
MIPVGEGNAVLSALFFDRHLTAVDFWKAARFTAIELADPAVSGDLADPDGDGIPNLMEYALGLEPRQPDQTGLPFAKIMDDYFTLTYNRRKGATDLSLVVEVSDDLLIWRTGAPYVEELQIVDGEEAEMVTVRSRLPVSQTTQRFMRLRAVRN